MEWFVGLMLLLLVDFMIFSLLVPFAFTGAMPDEVKYEVRHGGALYEKFYTASYIKQDDGSLVLCGYWDPPSHTFWDINYDWVGEMKTLPAGTYTIRDYPTQCVPPCQDCSEPK